MRKESTKIHPHPLFIVWSPDEVAECLEGVTTALGRHLWEEAADYDGKPRSEVPDDFGERALAKYWDRFTDEEKAQLNKLADAHDAYIDNLTKRSV